ncbi:MAG: hypothetical protein AB7I27_17685 [Bacteriovoracaceae bacterium]
MKLILFVLISLFLNNAFSAGTKNEDGSFKLQEKSLKTMGIKFEKLSGKGPWLLPSNALVKIKFTQGVYRKIDEDITYVLVSTLKADGNSVLVSSVDLESDDEVAIEGVHFLRLTEADLNSDTVDNCAH